MVDVEIATLGRVKWYDPTRGFGFVSTDDLDSDVLLHVNVVRNFGLNSIAQGALVHCRIAMTDRGAQVVAIERITPPENNNPTMLEEVTQYSAPMIAELPLLPARVKWFNLAKGFGFARAFGSSDDIFVHMDIVQRSGLATLTAGEAITLRYVDGSRGLMAVEIGPWEAE